MTESEQNEWELLLQKLQSTIPGVSELIDEQTGALVGGAEAVAQYVENWRNMEMAEVYMQAASEKMTELVAVETELTTAKQNHNAALNEQQMLIN